MKLYYTLFLQQLLWLFVTGYFALFLQKRSYESRPRDLVEIENKARI